jgi:hypothetical protein
VSRRVCGVLASLVGVRDWRLLFPGSCHVRGERPGGSRTGRSPAAAGGAGGVLEVTGREPDDLAAGNGSRGAVRGMRLFSGPSHVRCYRCGQCRWLQSSLRRSRPWPGCMGRVRVRRGGQAGSIKWAPAPAGPRRRGRQTGDLAPGRWPGNGLFMPPALAAGLPVNSPRGAWTGSGSARRACRRRPGSGAGGRRRPWRCCGLPSRGGR